MLGTGLGQLSLSWRRGGGGGTPAPASGTSETRYSVMGTSFRWPTSSRSHATNTFFILEKWFGTPDYATTDPRIFCATFLSPSSGGETKMGAGTATVQGWSIETSAGVWTACDGALEAGVAALTAADDGAWLPRVQCTLAANTMYRMRLVFKLSGTGIVMPTNTAQAGSTAPGGQGKSSGGTTTFFAKLTDNTAVSHSGGGSIPWEPAMMIAKGGDGRKAILVLGDSIGFGANDNAAHQEWTARNAFGFVERGLDSNTGALRLGYHVMCIPGQAPAKDSGSGDAAKGWDLAARWAGKRYAVQWVIDNLGDAPFDEVLSQHITNSIPYGSGENLRVGMSRYYDLVAGWGKPITQIECLGGGLTSSDGYATVAGQTPGPGYDYPADDAWDFNGDVGGADGLGDAAAYYRAQGKIIGSIGAWRYVAADLTTNRDKYPVRPFSTTLASAYVSGSAISTVAAPTPGMQLYMEQDSGTYGTGRDVATVTGSGPYTVTLNGSPGTAAAIGKVVRDAWGDGIHPSGRLHKDILPVAITDWKAARGWV